MTQSSGPNKPSLRRSVALTAVAALLAISAILVAYSEIRGASLIRRHIEASINVQADLVHTMLDLYNERFSTLARQIAADPEVDTALMEDSVSSNLEEALRIIRDGRSERPALIMVSSTGNVIASAADAAFALGPEILGQPVQRAQTRLLVDGNNSPMLVHGAPVRRGDRVVGSIWVTLPVSAGIENFFPRLAGLAYLDADGASRTLYGIMADIGSIVAAGDLRARSTILSDNEGRRLDATVLPLQYGRAETIGGLILLRDVSDTLRREELLTVLAFTSVVSIILLSLGVLLQKLRVGFRPLGAVVQLLGAMSGGVGKTPENGPGELSGLSNGFQAEAVPDMKSGREIATLLRAVDSFRASLDAHNTLIAVTEQLENARRIQQSLLPASFKLHPSLDIFGQMRPALDVAGDFFDTFVLGDGRIAILIADVSGKGIAPALFAAQASALLRAQCHQSTLPAKVIQSANSALCERNPEDMFLTAILAVVTPATGVVNFVNAGHCPPMIADEEGQIRLVSTPPDMVLGVLPDLEWSPHRLVLAPGERILFYSDGFDEAQTVDGSLLGTDGVMKIFKDACAKGKSVTSRFLCKLMLDEIDSFAAGAPQADDISLLVIHRPKTKKGKRRPG